MKRIIPIFAFLLAVFALQAFAQQSNPGFVYGFVPSAAQWNGYFSSKLDYNAGGLPILYGGTGATTAQGALNNITGAVASGYYLRGNGTGVMASTIQAGDVPLLNQNTTGTAGGIVGGALGSLLYQTSGTGTGFLAGNVSATPKFVTSAGNGSTTLAPTLTTSTGTGNVVLDTNAVLTTPNIGAATATSVNGLAITASTGTLTVANSKTLTSSNTLTLAGTDGTVMTFPSTSATIARTDTSQSFSGTQTFTATASFSGTITGTAWVSSQASPNPIGSSAPNTGAFTTLAASSTVSGAGFSTYLASPPAIGGSAAAAGSFTTLSASSTVSGTGFSAYLASPPSIGTTAAGLVKGTTVTATTGINLGNMAVSATAPTIGSCGSSPSISASNGTIAFRVITSNPAGSTCSVTLPAAATGWNCFAQDITTVANAWQQKISASSTTSITITNYSAGSPTNFTAADVLAVSCFAL